MNSPQFVTAHDHQKSFSHSVNNQGSLVKTFKCQIEVSSLSFALGLALRNRKCLIYAKISRNHKSEQKGLDLNHARIKIAIGVITKFLTAVKPQK